MLAVDADFSGRTPLAWRGVADAAALGVLALLLYGLTACPTFFGGDSAELAAAAATFGVPHPPGYPLYTLVTGLLLALTPFEDAARAANLASAAYAALAVALAHLLLLRLGVGRIGAWIGAATLAVGATFWAQALVSEVYSFDVLLFFVAAHAALAAGRSSHRAVWLAAGLTAGLWVGHRIVNVVYLPGLIGIAWAGARAVTPRARFPLGLVMSAGLGLGLAGLALLYLPLASARDPAIDIGDPESWSRLWVVLSGSPYRRHLEGTTAVLAAGRLVRWTMSLWRELGLGAILALVGGVTLLRQGGPPRWLAVALGWIAATSLAFAARYNVLDIEVFFLPSFVVLALLAGFGAEPVCTRLRSRWAGGALLALVVASGLMANFETNDRSWNYLARRSAEDLIASAQDLEQPGSKQLLFVTGDTTIHGAWYLQAVERRAPEVLVVSLGHMHPWHLEQLAARHPDFPWPVSSAGMAAARAILDAALERGMRVFVAMSVNRDELLAPGPRSQPFAWTLVRGTAWEVIPMQDKRPAVATVEWNARFLDSAIARLGAVPEALDPDSRSTLLSYALAAAECAEFAERVGQPEVARRAWEHVLRLEPDRHEWIIREDVRRGIGQTIPSLRLEERARMRLAEL